MKKYTFLLLLIAIFLASTSCKNTTSSPVAGPSFTLVQPFSFWAFGSNGTGNSQFTNPNGIALDQNGNIYVTDWNNNTVQKFTSNGSFLAQFGGGQLSTPAGLAVWGGVVYVTDGGSGHNRVDKYDLSGNYLGSFSGGDGGFNGDTSIAFDALGNIYVTDGYNNRVQKFNSSGSFLLEWGSSYNNPGSGNGQFNHPGSINVDANNNIYVCDSGNYRIEKFDVNGNYILQWGSFGSGKGQFEVIGGMAVDNNGHVYVGDQATYRIQKFDGMGNFITQWEGNGSNLGQYSNKMQGLACNLSNLNGSVYVADANNYRVEVTNNPYDYAGLNTLGVFPDPVTTGQDADIAFQLGSSLNFSITIKDSLGNTVNQYQGQGVQGDNILQWNMTSSGGSLVDPGVYFVTFQSGSTSANQKLTYTR